MSIQLAMQTTLPETIVSTDAIEQLSPFVTSGHAGVDHSSSSRGTEYWLSGVGGAQKLVTSMPLVAGDVLTVCGCHFGVSALIAAVFGHTIHANYFWQGLATGVVYIAVGIFMGLFPATAVSPVYELRQTVLTSWLAFGLMLVSNHLFAVLSTYELMVGVLGAAVSTPIVPMMRTLVRHYFSRFSWWGERMIIIGSGIQGQAIYRFYKRGLHRGLRPIGIVDSADNAYGTAPSLVDTAIPYLGSIDQLGPIVRKHHVQWGIVAPGGCDGMNMSDMVRYCGVLPSLVLLPTDMLVPSLWSTSRECAGVMSVHVKDHLRNPFANMLKRSFDILATSLGLVLVSPLLLVIAILIKYQSPGPVFFGHERIGKSGKRFKAWKIRSMVTNAAEVLDECLERDPEMRRQWMEDQKLKNDPRIIPGVGNFIRKTSLDELPQLWNVLRGEMSLVGPRPIVTNEVERYQQMITLYYRVKPGLTGLWQVSGRNNTSYLQRVRLDSYYVCNWSLWLDIYIILRTIRTVIKREGAF